MNYRLIVLFFIILVSCKIEKEKKAPKKHNPYEYINQNLKTEKAISLFNKVEKNIKNGKIQTAKKHLEECLKIENSPIILNEFGVIALLEKKRTEAIDFFNRSISLDRTYYPSHINKSRVLILLKENGKAEKTLKDMLSICESNYWRAYANMYLAHIAVTKKHIDCEKAKKHIEKTTILETELELLPQLNKLRDEINKNCS